MTPTAKERAVAVLNAATVEWTEGPGDPDVDEVLVAALMADPGLLVDLAIEAGGLTVDGPCGSLMSTTTRATDAPASTTRTSRTPISASPSTARWPPMPGPIWEPSPARGCVCALAAGAVIWTLIITAVVMWLRGGGA